MTMDHHRYSYSSIMINYYQINRYRIHLVNHQQRLLSSALVGVSPPEVFLRLPGHGDAGSVGHVPRCWPLALRCCLRLSHWWWLSVWWLLSCLLSVIVCVIYQLHVIIVVLLVVDGHRCSDFFPKFSLFSFLSFSGSPCLFFMLFLGRQHRWILCKVVQAPLTTLQNWALSSKVLLLIHSLCQLGLG